MGTRRAGGAAWVWVVLVLFLLGMGYLGWLIEGPLDADADTYQINEPLDGAISAEINIRAGIAELYLDSGAVGGPLLSGEVGLIPGEELGLTRDEHAGGVRLELAVVGSASRSMTSGQETWNLIISPEIPLTLELEAGIGKAELDLSGLWLDSFNYRGGIGSAQITLPQEGNFAGRVVSGEGEATILIPAGLVVRIETQRGLGTVEVAGLERVGRGIYQTPGFDGGSVVSVAAGTGNIHIAVLE